MPSFAQIQPSQNALLLLDLLKMNNFRNNRHQFNMNYNKNGYNNNSNGFNTNGYNMNSNGCNNNGFNSMNNGFNLGYNQKRPRHNNYNNERNNNYDNGYNGNNRGRSMHFNEPNQRNFRAGSMPPREDQNRGILQWKNQSFNKRSQPQQQQDMSPWYNNLNRSRRSGGMSNLSNIGGRSRSSSVPRERSPRRQFNHSGKKDIVRPPKQLWKTKAMEQSFQEINARPRTPTFRPQMNESWPNVNFDGGDQSPKDDSSFSGDEMEPRLDSDPPEDKMVTNYEPFPFNLKAEAMCMELFIRCYACNIILRFQKDAIKHSQTDVHKSALGRFSNTLVTTLSPDSCDIVSSMMKSTMSKPTFADKTDAQKLPDSPSKKRKEPMKLRKRAKTMSEEELDFSL